MFKKCWGCNEYKINIFSWLAGSNLCDKCKSNIYSKSVNDNYKINMSESEKGNTNKTQENIDTTNVDKSKKIKDAKDTFSPVFFLLIIIFIIFAIFSFFSNEKHDCVPIYSQEPTQEQINAIENSRKAGLYGDNYLLSKKIGCE